MAYLDIQEKEKCEMDAYYFNKGQLMDLENYNVKEEKNVSGMELEVIDVAT